MDSEKINQLLFEKKYIELWNLILKYVELKVLKVFNRSNLSRYTTVDDIMQDMWIVFDNAIKKYDVNKNPHFICYYIRCVNLEFFRTKAKYRIIPIANYNAMNKKTRSYEIHKIMVDSDIDSLDAVLDLGSDSGLETAIVEHIPDPHTIDIENKIIYDIVKDNYKRVVKGQLSQDIFRLIAIEGYKPIEVAKIYKVKITNITSNYCNAMKLIRKFLKTKYKIESGM